MKYTYRPKGICASLITVDVEDNKVVSVDITGGCPGNLQGIAALCRGRRADEVARTLRGIRCGNKPTSCPDQIALAIEQNIN